MRLAYFSQASRWSLLLLFSLALILDASTAEAADQSTARTAAPAAARMVQKARARQPIAFFPANGSGASGYLSHLPGYDLAIRATGMTIRSERRVGGATKAEPAFDGGVHAAPAAEQVVRRTMSLEFVGANAAAQVEGLDAGRARVNRLVGRDPAQWQRDLPTYGRVRAHGLYPGVDLVYYGGRERALEYDLVVAPHADLARVRFRVDGDAKPVLEADGSLDLDGKDGGVRLQRPVLYQDENGGRKAILGGFVRVAPGEFGFKSVAYDHSRPLIVDPQIQLIYATYIGGIHNDEEFDMAVDASGSAYIVGASASQDFPVTGNALQTTRQNIGTYTYDAVILKFDASGDLIYSTFLGGSSNDYAYSVIANADGSVYVGGGTSSSDFPVTTGAYQTKWGGGSDGFLVKISNDGSQLLYSTYLGGAADESVQSLLLNTDGTLWIGGDASGAGLTPSATAAQKAAAGNDNYFLAKAVFNVNGALSLPYLTFLGGSATGQEGGGVAMTTDSAGNLYLAGGTNSADFPVTANAYEKPFPLSNGCYNSPTPNTVGTVTKFSPDLSQMLYSTVIGGHIEDQNGYPDCNQFVLNIHLDAAGNMWLIGTTGMSDFPTTSNAMSKQLNGNGYAGVDDFIAELSASGTSLLYGTFFGGSAFDYGARAVWDPSGNIWMTGTTQSTDYPVTANAVQPANAGGYDTGVTEFSPTATSILYSTFLGGSGDDDINGSGQIKLDTQGNVHLAGGTSSTNYPVTATAVQGLFANGDQGPDGTDVYYSVLGTGLIGAIGPVMGGNTGDTTITVSGAGFQAGASCSLVMGGTTITATQVSISPTGTSITCTFPLNGATAGSYDVTVSNPNSGGSFTKTGAFTVQSGGAPKLWVNIVARPKIRTGVASSVVVTYGNSGTVDGYMSHLVLTMPSQISGTYNVGIPPNLPSGMQVPTSVTTSGQNQIRLLLPRVPAGSSGSFQMQITDNTNNDNYQLQAAIAKPWFTSATTAAAALSTASSSYTPSTSCGSTAPTNCLGYYLTQLANNGATAAQAESIAGTMLSTLQQVEKYGFLPVIQGGTSLTYVPPSTLVTGTLVISGIVSFDNTIEYHIAGLSQQNTIPITASNCVSYAGDVNDANGTLLRCTLTIQAPTGSPITIAGGSYGIGGELIPSFDTCFTTMPNITGAGFTVNVTAGTQFCALNSDTGDEVSPKVPDDVIITIGGFENTESSTDVDLYPGGDGDADDDGTSGGSIDPNGKIGPLGDASTNHYVKPANSLSYNVYFENEASATLPAGQVVVTDQLDGTKVDLSTITFGPVNYGTNAITPPAGSSGFTKTYVPPGVTNYVVRVQGSADQNTGLVKWTFTTIDPATNLPPSDPTVGFLPPDVDGVVGQGGVTFNVMPLGTPATGTAIPNGASVVFDANAAIATPVWTNMIDGSAPLSAVAALPAVETVTGSGTTASFPVAWSGTDTGSGIKTYTIYASDNGGAFTPWQTAVTTTTANYTGTAGHTYGFYSIATDGAGNVQASKTSADTGTQVSSLQASTTTLTVSSTSVTVGTSVMLSASVAASAGTGTPTGMVTFKDGASTVLGSGTVAAGKASYTASALALGGHTITAVYGGDSSFAGSTSNAINVMVTAPADFSVALSAGSGTVTGGSSATSMISVSSSGGFAAAVAFSCSGLPAYSACSFNPATITTSGTMAATSTLTISTNVATAALDRPGFGRAEYGLVAAAGLFGFLLRLKRRRPWLAATLLCGLLMAGGVGLAGCGTPGVVITTPVDATPKGSYTVTITATSGATVHTANYALTVQ
jgi:hypothetical protein